MIYWKFKYLRTQRALVVGVSAPSVQSKLNATFLWIDKFIYLVPNPNLSIEVGKFDIAKMINPDIKGEEYQNGDCKDYYDVRYFVFARDNYICQLCKKKNKVLHTHHIVYKSKGGTDRADNLISICTDCHTSENHKQGGILYEWMLKKKKVKQYKEATFMNSVRKRTFSKYPNARITYGSETTPKRKELELDKTHYNDAITISGIKSIKENSNEYFYYKQFRKKKRSLHETIPRKGLKQKNVNAKRNNKNTPYSNGFYLNDKVNVFGKIGWISGFCSGGCYVKDIEDNYVTMPNKNYKQVSFKNLKFISHNNNWQFIQRS